MDTDKIAKQELKKNRKKAAGKYIRKEIGNGLKKFGGNALFSLGKFLSPIKPIDDIIDVARMGFNDDRVAEHIENKQNLARTWNHSKWWGGNSNSVGAVNGMLTQADQTKQTNGDSPATVQTPQIFRNTVITIGGFVEEAKIQVLQQIDDVISALATTRGIATTITASEVVEYLKTSAELLGLMFSGYRAQNAANLFTQTGQSIRKMLLSIPNASSSSNDTGLSASANISTVTEWGIDTISNATWLRDYVSRLQVCYCSENLFELYEYLYKDFFAAGVRQSADNVLTLYPSVAFEYITDNTRLKTFVELFDAKYTALRNLQAGYPEITTILELLGISNKKVMSYDWTRDLAAKTFKLHVDDTMILALQNANPTFSTLGINEYSAAIQATFWTNSPNLSVIAFENLSTLEIGQFMSMAKFRGRLRVLGALVMDQNQTVTCFKYLPVGTVDVTASSTKDAVLATTFSNLTTAMKQSYLNACDIQPPLDISYEVTSNGTTATVNMKIKHFMLGGDALFISDWETFVAIAQTTLVFGQNYAKDLRDSLAKVTNSIQSIK